MKYIWTDAGDDPSWGDGDRHGIDGYFFPMEDAVTTTELVSEAEGRGHAYGLYQGHNWHPGFTPGQLAQVCLDEYRRITKSSTVLKKLRLQVNIEQADPLYIGDVFELLRVKLPTVGLSWSLMGMQGGWMSPSFVARIIVAKVRVVPEAFWGADGRMEGIYDTRALVRNLTERGFPDSLVSPMIDAKYASIIRGWDGYAFTMGRLP